MKKRKAFTILELILTIALISIVIIAGTRFLMFGINANAKTLTEFEIQSHVRVMTQSINKTIRDASGIFLMNKDYPDANIDVNKYLTEGWNYMMLNEDKTQLVEWTWDGEKHIQRILVDSLEGVTFDLTYNKKNPSNVDRLVRYNLKVNTGNKEKEIASELEGLNTLQIIDKSFDKIPNTIAYREDPRITDVGVSEAAVSFIIDKSGSMNETLKGSKTRLDILKTEAQKMINGLAEYENINLSITPFSNTANSLKDDDENGDNFNKMMSLKDEIKDGKIKNIIDSIVAEGGTNTGDGMRRGFYSIVDFNKENEDKAIKNFMIILVDGETNLASITERISREITQNKYEGDIIKYHENQNNERIYVFDREEGGIWLPFIGWVGRKYIYKTYEEQINYPIYRVDEENYITYYTGTAENVSNDTLSSSSSVPWLKLSENDYKKNGHLYGFPYTNYKPSPVQLSHITEYVNIIGSEITDYKNTRHDSIDVFVIGFSNDISTTGLNNIKDAANAKKVYQANSEDALKAVLNEIKFQITDELWHIGGPN